MEESERFRRGKSLEGDLAAGLFDLSLGLLGVFLLRGGEDGGGRGVNQVLGFLEAQAGQVLDDLDDGDLLVTGGLEDDLELVLLFGGGGVGGRGGNGDGCGGSGLNVEGLLEELHEVGELDEGHFLESCDELVIGELSHEWHPS